MYDKLTVMDMANQQMEWLAKRTEVLAENVANADTPGYTPKDLKTLDFKAVLTDTQQQAVGAPRVTLAATNPRHIVPQSSPAEVVSESKVYEASPDGNAVGVEDQMNKMGNIKNSYDQAASLYQKQVALLKLAIMGHE